MTDSNAKPKLALYWAASCGGCEITVTELGLRLVEVGELVDIVFWPCVMDFKYSDVSGLDDGEIDVCLFNGTIRTSENEHLAKLLRQKSKVLVAGESILERVYDTAPSLDDSRGTLTHHYVTDERGILEKVNLIVGTTNNYAAIGMSIKKAAQGLTQPGKPVSDGTLNTIEMAFRAYDPCMACATHTLPGQMELPVRVYNHE